jgi:hypothetical protein
MSWGVSDAALASRTDTLDVIGDAKANVTRRNVPPTSPKILATLLSGGACR